MTRIKKIEYSLSLLFKASIAILILASLFQKDFFIAFASIFVLFITFLPAILRRAYKIHLPNEIDFLLTLVLWLHFFLGEYNGFYTKVWWWDLFLHGGNSIILGLIGFIFSYSLLLTSRIDTKPFFVSFFSLTFAVFVGVLWEIFEFAMDGVFGFNMQKSGLPDTMTDLIVDTLGALVIAIMGFFYMKKPSPGFFESLIKKYCRKKNSDC